MKFARVTSRISHFFVCFIWPYICISWLLVGLYVHQIWLCAENLLGTFFKANNNRAHWGLKASRSQAMFLTFVRCFCSLCDTVIKEHYLWQLICAWHLCFFFTPIAHSLSCEFLKIFFVVTFSWLFFLKCVACMLVTGVIVVFIECLLSALQCPYLCCLEVVNKSGSAPDYVIQVRMLHQSCDLSGKCIAGWVLTRVSSCVMCSVYFLICSFKKRCELCSRL